MYGGAALNEEVGNSLASKGVSLYDCYGWCVIVVTSHCLYCDILTD